MRARWPSSPTRSRTSSSKSRGSAFPWSSTRSACTATRRSTARPSRSRSASGPRSIPALVEPLYTMTAAEARARGTHQALTPVVDVARDPRWGRVEETFGEDPYLVSRMGIAAVRGFQGDATFRDKTHVIATLKHFAAHGQPESGTNCAPVNVSKRVLRETFLYTFREAIREGGAISVMASYNEIDGVPSHANRWLLRDVLRNEWGFTGYVVSDYYAIRELTSRPDFHGHFVAHDKPECVHARGARRREHRAARAGLLPAPRGAGARRARSQESELDELVAPMLLWKFKLGLFDDPYVDPGRRRAAGRRRRASPLARQAARETITLLKNDGNVPCRSIRRGHSDDRGDRAERGPRAARRLQRRAKSMSRCSKGSRRAPGRASRCAMPKAARSRSAARGTRTRACRRIPAEDARLIAEAVAVAQRRRRHRARHRRQRADLARGVVGQAPGRHERRSTWSGGRTSWFARCSPPASRSSRSCLAAGRLR